MNHETKKPTFYRPISGHVFGWEIYSWRTFFLTFALGTVEIQINNWGREKQRSE